MNPALLLTSGSRLLPAASARVPVRGAGDGMETEKPRAILEVNTDTRPPSPSAVPLLKVASPKRSPEPTHAAPPPPPAAPQPLGVLHLGKVSREACTEVEAVRIVVPRAAISRSSRAGPAEERGEAGQEEQGSPPLPLVEDWRTQLEKLQNSERRLLQDKEGLSNQLRVQTEVRTVLSDPTVAPNLKRNYAGFVTYLFYIFKLIKQLNCAGLINGLTRLI